MPTTAGCHICVTNFSREIYTSLPKMAGVTSVSGLALAAFFQGLSLVPTCNSHSTSDTSLGLPQGPLLTCPLPVPPTRRQGGQAVQLEEVKDRVEGKRLVQSGWQTYRQGRQPRRKGSAWPRSNKRDSIPPTGGGECVQRLDLLNSEPQTFRCLGEDQCSFKAAFQRQALKCLTSVRARGWGDPREDFPLVQDVVTSFKPEIEEQT